MENAIRILADDIARELDRRGLLQGSCLDRVLSDAQLRDVAEVIEALLPRYAFTVHWARERHLRAELHARGGPYALETTVIATDKDSARRAFYSRYPDATVMTIEQAANQLV